MTDKHTPIQNSDNENDNELNKVIASATASIEVAPSALLYFKLGNAYQNKMLYDDAINAYSEALKIDSIFVAAYDNRAFIYSHKGEYKKAIADYTQVIELYIKFPPAYFNRGNAHRGIGNLPAAIKDYTYAVALWNQQGDKDNAAKVQKLIDQLSTGNENDIGEK